MNYILLYLCVINVATFFLYGYDKRKAVKNKRRVPEKVLHLWALFGGSIGAFVGQRIFRHKIAKASFQLAFFALIILQLSILVFIWKM